MASNAARCYKIGPGERLRRRELGRGRGLLVRSAAEVVAEGQRRKRRMRMKMRLRKGEIGGRAPPPPPSAKSLKMPSPPPQKLNGPLLDVDEDGNATSSFGEDLIKASLNIADVAIFAIMKRL